MLNQIKSPCITPLHQSTQYHMTVRLKACRERGRTHCILLIRKATTTKTSPSFRSLTWLKNLMGSKPRRPGLCPPSRFCRISSIVIHRESAICNPPLCHPLLFCTNLSQVVHLHSTPPVANSYNPVSLYHTHRAEANDMICCTERDQETERERYREGEGMSVCACMHTSA